ncbi:ABC transporter ATP-binding protein [bacterium]|nr:ABC transporter ATP-binding protein [bacterium]
MSNVEFQNITKIFRGHSGAEVVAVDKLNLEIKTGELVTLLGPSGCGKTTILRMLAGFEEPSGGEIYLDEKNVVNLPPNKRDLSMMFQSYGLFPHMSIFNNIAYGLKLRGFTKKEIKQKVFHILKLMDLNEVASRSPRQLSGGQQQRVALARALVIEPKVLLFDEPLSNLDAKLRVAMREEIRKLQQRLNITAVYVTHDQEEAMSISDRIVLLNCGKVEQMGSPSEIYLYPKNRFVANFIGKANFIPARVDGMDDKYVTISIANIKTHLPKRTSVKLGDKIDVVLRPEAIKVGQPYEGKFQGSVDFVSYLGSQLIYEVKAFGQILTIEIPNPKGQIDFKVGDKISLSFNESQLHYV